MVEDESDVFEINDFTTSSEWERFVAKIEEIQNEWKIKPIFSRNFQNKNENILNNIWEEYTWPIQFADYQFLFVRHIFKNNQENISNSVSSKIDDLITNKQKEIYSDSNDVIPEAWKDIMSCEEVFPGKVHCINRWFGLKDFAVLSLLPGIEEVISESKLNMLLSSISIACHNTSCNVPIFVQTHKKARRLYFGSVEYPGFQTCFDTIQLQNAPAKYSHLSGLLDIFKNKIASPVSCLNPASISIRLTYVIQDWSKFPWLQLPPDFDNGSNGEIGINGLGNLPFGSNDDPIGEFYLSTTWPNLSEELITENEVYTDLDPMYAPLWHVRVRMSDRSHTLLVTYLKEFLNLHSRNETAEYLIGKSSFSKSANEEVNASQALHKLTESNVPTIDHVVKKATSKLNIKSDESPISANLLNDILLNLFPDVKPDLSSSEKNMYEYENFNDQKSQNLSLMDTDDLVKDIFPQIKTAPFDSISSKLSEYMCIVNHCNGGLKAVAQLWQEFVMEMRHRWENNLIIPGLELGSPNMRCCLIYQKLQMLNCCIERKKNRESGNLYNTPTHNSSSELSLNTLANAEDDEEFFECIDFVATPNSKESIKGSEGRLKNLNNLKLLEVDEFLYVPITQEPSPMTEDLLEEHAEVLSRLGTSAEGTQLRARMQSACLLSDMESFKAANPGCVLGDFVRWYSPRDWIEEVQDESAHEINMVKGHLSQRMEIPGNMWMEVWKSAKSVPARRQRRLFDDTKEAEKVLHWLVSMKMSDVVFNLMPILIQSALRKLLQFEESKMPFLKKHLTQLSKELTKISRSFQTSDIKCFEEVIRHIGFIEMGITQAQSLFSKFQHVIEPHLVSSQIDLCKFVSELLELPEVKIEGAANSTLGSLVKILFLNAYEKDQENDSNSSALIPQNFSNTNFGDVPILQRVSNDQMNSQLVTQDYNKSSNFDKIIKPMGKEYILRGVHERPAPWSRPSVQRLYCAITAEEFRMAGAFSNDTTFF